MKLVTTKKECSQNERESSKLAKQYGFEVEIIPELADVRKANRFIRRAKEPVSREELIAGVGIDELTKYKYQGPKFIRYFLDNRGEDIIVRRDVFNFEPSYFSDRSCADAQKEHGKEYCYEFWCDSQDCLKKRKDI